MKKNKYLVTGSAGFIGFHLCSLLLEKGFQVIGYDGMTDYYDVSLKERRHSILQEDDNFTFKVGMLEDYDCLLKVVKDHKPDIIIHLAAQAGVRYSLENPRAYVNSNLIGTFNIMECAREVNVKHLLMASTSSVYGSNTEMPFDENQKTDTPLTFYAATKKANESMAHSYSHLWKIPTTMFRFFTVYGPWGRPDMALFKFTKGIIEGKPIDIYNNGDMYRDFTYVSDLVNAISLLADTVPGNSDFCENDSLSEAAPYRVVNIGNSEKVRLLDFIEEIENVLGKKAIRNYMEMQKGDVPATWANASLLNSLTNYKAGTDYKAGVRKFILWYKEFYSC
ncbi:GDP-mannose 4,6-dehydratase [Gammaproteobacteria bacterium]|nr:GDP-mannose 4,6-dehydratase [Gammaproteobacteria bacterium]